MKEKETYQKPEIIVVEFKIEDSISEFFKLGP